MNTATFDASLRSHIDTHETNIESKKIIIKVIVVGLVLVLVVFVNDRVVVVIVLLVLLSSLILLLFLSIGLCLVTVLLPSF